MVCWVLCSIVSNLCPINKIIICYLLSCLQYFLGCEMVTQGLIIKLSVYQYFQRIDNLANGNDFTYKKNVSMVTNITILMF